MFHFTFDNCAFCVSDICAGEYYEDISGHKHSKNGYEIHLDTSGKGTLITENTCYELIENTFYVTGPDVYHKQVFDKSDPLFEYSIYIELISKDGDSGKLAAEFLKNRFWIGKGNKRLAHLLEQIHCTNLQNNDCTELELDALLNLVLCEIVKIYNPAFLNATTDIIKSRNKIIEDELLYNCHNITLKSLSKKLNLSERQTERLLKESFSKNFSVLKRESQIEKAIGYLEQGTPINEIAEKCGFCNASAFFRAFKAVKNTTPKRYKEKTV